MDGEVSQSFKTLGSKSFPVYAADLTEFFGQFDELTVLVYDFCSAFIHFLLLYW